MEKDIDGGLRVKINQKDNTCSVIRSPKASGTVCVPRFVEHENNKYKITSIETYAFSGCHIDLLTFPEDSEIESLGSSSLRYSHIKKLKIPPSLKRLGTNWCDNVSGLAAVEVSPKNAHFTFYGQDFLLGKSGEGSAFDVLHFARADIERAAVPAQVRVIERHVFDSHDKLKSVTFSPESELRAIEDDAFSGSSIHRLELPASLERLGDRCFYCTRCLADVEVSPGNKFFRKCGGNLVVRESERGSGVFDVLVFVPRDAESATIPRHIRVINNSAFQYCTRLASLAFEANSSLEVIGDYAFSDIAGPERIVFPPSVRKAESSSFTYIANVKCIEFLGKSVEIGSTCFSSCRSLTSVTFPNSEHVALDSYAMLNFPDGAKLFVKRSAKLDGRGADSIGGILGFIDDGGAPLEREGRESEAEESADPTERSAEPGEGSNAAEKRESGEAGSESEELEHLKKFNSYLISRLRRYEAVPGYDEFVCRMEGEIEQGEGESVEHVDGAHAFVGADDEEFHEVVSKIGGGATSEVFKIRDTRTGETLCKKVIKECGSEAEFKMLQSAMKEIGAHGSFSHECICRLLGFNLNEEVAGSGGAKTTVALFFEFLQFSVKSVMQSGLMSNTLKARMAVEVCFGMSHIHACGMMHRDLKLDNIMMNGVFESKIIDLGLARDADASGSASSLTTGVGTLAYMSPEMLNEDSYDAKTDVYSYGVVLFALFTGDVPKQKMRDRMNNVPIAFPAASPSMSAYCIDLIKRCTSFDASQRPTFDEIADDMAAHSFALASEIDTKSVFARFRELDAIRKRNRMQRDSGNE